MVSKMELARTIASKVEELHRVFPCVLLTGARQVGKSTLLRHLLPEGMQYVTLDDELLRRVGIVELYSLSQSEAAGYGAGAEPFDPERIKARTAAPVCDITKLYERIWRGGYPRLYKCYSPGWCCARPWSSCRWARAATHTPSL